jgi:hypothetical protein
LIPPQVAQLAGKAMKAVQRSGPDPVVFIFLGLIFATAAPFVTPKWLLAVLFVLLVAAYCWRRDRVEAHEIRLAQLKLEQESAKLQLRKQTHRLDEETVQPLLPLLALWIERHKSR